MDDDVEVVMVLIDEVELPIEVDEVDDDIELMLIADIDDEIDVNEFLFLGIL